VEELYRVRGFDAHAVAALRPYVTALPAATLINANTASEVLIAAALGVRPESVSALLAERRTKPFGAADLDARLRQAKLDPVSGVFDVKSGYFAVAIQVTQDDVYVATEALLQRAGNGKTTIVWRRPRY
jgi:general secretion pathway protein K